MRSAAGVATISYRPGYRLAITAWPASGETVLPSDSYFGQVGIMPTKLPLGPSLRLVIGHASSPVIGSILPASEFDTGWLNMS